MYHKIGSQCHNSTLKPSTGQCVFPNTMHAVKKAEPLPILQDPTDPNSLTELTCPGPINMFLCDGGYYCDTAITIEKCPKGHFCPVGKMCFY